MGHLVNQVLPQDIRRMEFSQLKVNYKSSEYFQLKGSKLVNSR